jgi:hypothetical protein
MINETDNKQRGTSQETAACGEKKSEREAAFYWHAAVELPQLVEYALWYDEIISHHGRRRNFFNELMQRSATSNDREMLIRGWLTRMADINEDERYEDRAYYAVWFDNPDIPI